MRAPRTRSLWSDVLAVAYKEAMVLRHDRPLLATLGVKGKAGESTRVPTAGLLNAPLLVLVGLGPDVDAVFGVTAPYQVVQDYTFLAGSPLTDQDVRGRRDRRRGSAQMRPTHLLDRRLDAPPISRLILLALPLALCGFLRGLHFGLVAMRADKAPRVIVDSGDVHGIVLLTIEVFAPPIFIGNDNAAMGRI